MPFTDKSSPDIIERKFNMSKSTFKKTIGILYRQRKVTMEENGIRLVEGNDEKV
jgi:predicted RNA-binding protein (virulence factor B family)